MPIRKGLLGPIAPYAFPAPQEPKKEPKPCSPCRFPRIAPCPEAESFLEIIARREGTTNPVPNAKNVADVNTIGIEFSLSAETKRMQPDITLPIPTIVNFHSPNAFTNLPINPPCTIIAITPTQTSVRDGSTFFVTDIKKNDIMISLMFTF